MNEEQKQKLNKLRAMLAKLHQKWQDDPNRDGHHKMSEGYVGVTLSYPDWFDAECDADKYLNAEPEVSVEVYSYLFGPHRMHNFESLDEAIKEVSTWKS